MTTVTNPGAYVRDHYQVPAHIDARITFTWPKDPAGGVIVGFAGPHLLVRFDGDDETETEPAVLHPTWHIQYHPAEETTR